MKRINVQLLEQLQMQHKFLKEIRIKQTKHFGHMERHGNIPKGKVEGKKKAIGRQFCRWEDYI